MATLYHWSEALVLQDSLVRDKFRWPNFKVHLIGMTNSNVPTTKVDGQTIATKKGRESSQQGTREA